MTPKLLKCTHDIWQFESETGVGVVRRCDHCGVTEHRRRDFVSSGTHERVYRVNNPKGLRKTNITFSHRGTHKGRTVKLGSI